VKKKPTRWCRFERDIMQELGFADPYLNDEE
jgi:hypothetical protein